jgi:methionyl-tRNA formyltransferase
MRENQISISNTGIVLFANICYRSNRHCRTKIEYQIIHHKSQLSIINYQLKSIFAAKIVGMRIIFMGTPEFAVASLKALVESGEEVVCAVTATDKLGGRGGKQVLESAVKKYAVSQGIPVLQPEKLKAKSFLAELASFKADLQMVVAFRMLPEVVWDMPAFGTYNLHGSLLPKYRGAAPINWAIINGDKKTGVTTFKLKHEIDTGNVFLQKEMDILQDDTAGSVHDKMMELGAQAVVETVAAVKNGVDQSYPQDDALACPAPKIFHEDCKINFNQPTSKVYDFIRGLSPYPGAYTYIDELETKIIACMPVFETDGKLTSTVSLNPKSIHLHCTDGFIDVMELKMEGKRQMNIKDFLNGYSRPNS